MISVMASTFHLVSHMGLLFFFKRELKTQAGVTREIDIQNGVMTSLMVQEGMEGNLEDQAMVQSLLLLKLGAAKAMRSNWIGRIGIKGRGMNQSIEGS